MTHTTTCMNLENRLSEMSVTKGQVLSDATHRRSLGGVRSTETGRRRWGPGAGGGAGESGFKRDRLSVWEDEKVLEMMVGMVAQQCEYH